jgi:hypothetical protein
MIYFMSYDKEEYGYKTTTVVVWLCGDRLPTLDYLIEGCVDNRAGYGSLLVAERLRKLFEEAKSQGYTRGETSLVTRYTAKVAFHFQHYREDGDSKQYCSPSLDIGSDWPRMDRSHKLVKRLERAWKNIWIRRVFDNPQDLITVLKRLRAAPLDYLSWVNTSMVLYVSREKVRKPEACNRTSAVLEQRA